MFALDDDGAGGFESDEEELGDSLGAMNLIDDGDDALGGGDFDRAITCPADGGMGYNFLSPMAGPSRSPFQGGARAHTRSRCSSFSDKPEPPLGASPLLLNVFQQIAAEK